MSFFARGLCRHIVFALALLVYAVLPQNAQAAARQMPAGSIQGALPCKPFLEWMLDPGDALRIQDVASPERQSAFAALDGRFPPRRSGTLWLRFTMEPRSLENRQMPLLLDMGDGIPGAPLLFAPQSNAFTNTVEWQDIRPSRRSLFLLPEAQTAPQTLYIRLEGLPGPWFTPMLRTPHDAATAMERLIHPAILVALGVVMLLCLLRGLTERGQWRIWTGLYAGAALAYAVYGMPAAPGGSVPLRELPGVLAPGLALMLLPHVGRHLMQTRDRARGLDIQYLLLSLPGAALALLPLVPGHAWTSYYLALWPLAAGLFVPTSLGAWLSGLPGARRFLLACLLSMLGSAAGILGMYAFVSPLLAAGPLLGVSLGALLIAGTAIPGGYASESGRDAASQHRARNAPVQDVPKDFPQDVMDEPGLRLVTPDELLESAPPPPPTVPEAEQSAVPEAWLRPHLDVLLRESAAIALCALTPVARQHAEAMADAGRAMASLLSAAAPGMAAGDSPRPLPDMPHAEPSVRMAIEPDAAGDAEDDPDSEPPLDLPAPVEYGPGLAPDGGPFVPLSLDRNLALAPDPMPAAPVSVAAPLPVAPAMAPQGDYAAARHDAVEWVGEPMSIPRTRESASPEAPRHAAPPSAAPPSAPGAQDRYGYQSLDEWVGEPVPVPVPGSASVVSRDISSGGAVGDDSLLRPFDRQTLQPENAEANREEATPLSFPNARQGGLLDWVNGARAARTVPPPAYNVDTRYGGQSADEWVGEPTPRVGSAPASRMAASTPRPAVRAAPEPMREDFVPLRLTEVQTAPSAAPAAIRESVTLLPDDSAVPGFTREHPGTEAGTSDAAPLELVRAARDMVSRVRSRGEAPVPPPPRGTESAAPKRPAPDAVEQMQPLIPALLASLDEAMGDVRRGFGTADTIAVEEAAARIAARADNYGLRILARMARCVEMAAAARDKDALANILPDLETAVERNRIALQPKKQGS